jgi:iron complex outermembrane receptor protein
MNTRSARPAVAAGVLALISVPGPSSWAEEEERARTIEEVVVTARYREESLQDTPLAITAMNAQELEIRGFQSSYEIGYTVPNASFRPAQAAFGNTMSAFIRGVGQYDFDFAFEPGVGIYIDDVYHPFTLGSQVDLLDLERVEVLRGPQGTLFGRGSIGGTIRYVSKKPEGDNTGSIEVSVGEYDRTDIRASYDFAIAENLFARVAGVSRSRDGYQDVIDFACENPALAGDLNPRSANREKDCKIGTQGGEDVTGARLALRWVASDTVDVSLSAEYMDDSSEAKADTITEIIPGPGFGALYDLSQFGLGVPGVAYDERFIPDDIYKTYATYDDPRNGLSVKPETGLEKESYSARVDWDINENLGSTVILAYTDIVGRLATDADGSPLNLQLVDGVQTIDFMTAEVRFYGRAMDRVDWTVGGFYYDGEAVNDQMVSIPFLSFALDGNLPDEGADDPFVVAHNEHDVTSKSVFAHAVTDLTERLTLTTGLRFTDDEKDVNFDNKRVQNPGVTVADDHFDWMVSLGYNVSNEATIYTTAATGYRPGSYNPRPFQATQVVAVEQEESTAYELGVKTDLFDDRMRLNFAYFYTDWDTRILPVGGTECVLLDLGPPPVYLTDPAGTPDDLGNVCLDDQKVSRTFYDNGPAKIKGVEVEATWHVTESLTLTGLYGYTDWDSDDVNDDPNVLDDLPVYVPEDVWSVGLNHLFEFGNGSTLNSRVDVYGQSEICTSNRLASAAIPGAGCSDSYELVNGRLQWTSPDISWEVALGATNLTDKKYFLNKFDLTAFGQPTTEGQPGAPRQWYLTMKRNFF